MIPKMDDGENNGSKPYFLMDDLGGVYIYTSIFWKHSTETGDGSAFFILHIFWFVDVCCNLFRKSQLRVCVEDLCSQGDNLRKMWYTVAWKFTY